MIKLEKVSKVYQDGTHALKDINLVFNNCGLIYIKGKSGSGKSTLLNIIAGLSDITDGKILFDNKIIKNKNVLKERITYVAQDHNLISFLNIKDNIDINNSYEKDVLSDIGIDKLLDKEVSEISGGEAKRVEITRGLLDKSNILICDEPLNALDSSNAILIIKILKEISNNKLVIITGHNDSIIEPFADRIIEISKGEIVLDDNYENTKKINVNKYKKKDNVILFVNGLFKDKIKKNIFYILLFTILFSLLFIFFNIRMSDNQLDSSILINQNINRTYIEIDSNDIKNAIKLNKTNIQFSEAKVYYKGAESLNLNVNGKYSDYPYYRVLYNDLRFTVVNKDTFSLTDKIVGNVPKNGNEILISEYYYNCLKYLDILDSSIEKTIGEKIIIGEKKIKIVGILKQDIEKYEFIKTTMTTDSAYLSDLMEFFDYGISNVDTIYVSSEFENYIDFDSCVTKFLIYNSNNYYDLLSIKNSYDNSSYYNTDMYHDYVNRYQSVTNPIRNIILIAIVILIIVLMIMNYDYLLNVINVNKKDFYSLLYCVSSNSTIYNTMFRLITKINILPVLLGLVICNIALRIMNSYINTITEFDFNVFRFDLVILVTIIISFIIYEIIISVFNGRKILRNFNKQFK